MTTRSGVSYTPMGSNTNNGGNPNSGGDPNNGGQTTNTPSPSPLEDMMMEMMRAMCTCFDAMDNRFHELRIETDRWLNTLEQPDPPVREHRHPQVDREFNDQRGRNNFCPLIEIMVKEERLNKMSES